MRSRYRARRPDLDREAVRYFVYRLHDADGVIVYVGRSCDVPSRIRAHYSTIDHRGVPDDRKATWLLDCRGVSMLGPFTWNDACKTERAEIELHQPRGNRMHTKAHGYRPLSEGGGQSVGRVAIP